MTEIDPSPKTNKIKSSFLNLKTNWRSSSKEGEVLGYREILSFAFAGSGVNGIGHLASMVSLYSSTILMGSIFKISSAVLYLMTSLITLFSLVKTPIISLIMDNTGKRGGKGKFKPFLLWLGIPSAVLICLIPFVPVSWVDIVLFSVLGEAVSRAAIAIFIIHLLISFTFPVLLVAYNGLGQVITPNTLERGKVYSFQPILASFWNSVIGIIFPLLAGLTQQDAATGLESILSYRVFFPIFGLISFAFVLLAYFNVDERIIVPNDYKPKIKFWHGLKSFSSNKYFWIVIIGM
ncbi:MAG: MFS transporter, partial [Promethearchaeota archaeon]